MSEVIKAAATAFDFDVNSVSDRAVNRDIDKTISISGQSGSNGQPGSNGKDGHTGQHGGPGSNGTAGRNGSAGLDGQSGQSGTDSEHALIWLNGTVEHMNMRLRKFQTFNHLSTNLTSIDWNLPPSLNDVNYKFQLTQTSGFILVEAKGGHGGDGGHGGNGGKGGRGGQGGHGLHGHDGQHAYAANAPGGNGTNGGHGGNGGNGGSGGDGGSGADGGNAGAGGHVQVRSSDPRLLMLIELDCRAGVKGKSGHHGTGGSAGSGGAGGTGGRGGRGGNGGSGSQTGPNGQRVLYGPRGQDGSSGSTGHVGSRGNAGNDGRAGRDGRSANSGSIQYVVVDKDHRMIEAGPDKYHASVMRYTVTDENEDGIYEPNSDFFIKNVEWKNKGAMTLPDGAILSFPSTDSVSTNAKDVSVLPSAAVNQCLVDAHQFRCHLRAAPAPMVHEKYTRSVSIGSMITLLNRPFSDGSVTANLTCQYPINILNMKMPTLLGPHERTFITVTFENISSRSYGQCADSAGSIEFVLLTDSLFTVVPADDQYSYQTMSDSSARYKINKAMPAHSLSKIKFQVALDSNAYSKLYEHVNCEITLLLRDVAIERRRKSIRVVPAFVPKIQTDVLLVTNALVNRAEFVAYEKLFQLFKYTYQTWDIERYGSLGHPELTWLNMTNLIIFIDSEPQSTLKTIKSQLFLQHMNSSEKAGFISIGNVSPKDLDFALFDYNSLQFLNPEQMSKAQATDHLWSSFGFRRPSSNKIRREANHFRTKYEEQEDHEYLYQVVYDDTIDRSSAKCLTVIYGNRYVYKSALSSRVGDRLVTVTTKSPLLTRSHLPFTTPPQLSSRLQAEPIASNEQKLDLENMPKVDNVIKDEIDLQSHFGRVLCAILSYQGFSEAYEIIREKRELAYCTFRAGSIKFSFSQILVSLAMSIIEREYDRGSLEFEASEQLVAQIGKILEAENNAANDFGTQNTAWLNLLFQSLYEYVDSKFYRSFPWCGFTRKAKQRHKLQEILSYLKSLSKLEVRKNKEVYPVVQPLRLQKLANLQFPAAEKREDCVRKVNEIRAWQTEQDT